MNKKTYTLLINALLLFVTVSYGETIVGFDTLPAGYSINFEKDSIYEIDQILTESLESHDFFYAFGMCLLKGRKANNDACSWNLGMKRTAYISIIPFDDIDFGQGIDINDTTQFKPVFETITPYNYVECSDSPYVCFDHFEMLRSAIGKDIWGSDQLKYFYVVKLENDMYVVVKLYQELLYDCTGESDYNCHENVIAYVIRWFLQNDGSTIFTIPPVEAQPARIVNSSTLSSRNLTKNIYDIRGRKIDFKCEGQLFYRTNGVYIINGGDGLHNIRPVINHR
jgi:hypothetical protein